MMFGTTNELAKERNRAAAERTLNSWIGTCLSLIGTGVAFDQIIESLKVYFPGAAPGITTQFAHGLGLAFVGIGLMLLATALLQHRLAIKTIEREDYVRLSVTKLNRIAIVAILTLGFMGLIMIPLSL